MCFGFGLIQNPLGLETRPTPFAAHHQGVINGDTCQLALSNQSLDRRFCNCAFLRLAYLQPIDSDRFCYPNRQKSSLRNEGIYVFIFSSLIFSR